MGAAQSAYGMFQTGQAKRAERDARKKMEASRPGIPESADRMVARAERTYTEGMPQGRQQEAIGQRTAAGVSAMREGAVSSTQYLGGVTDMYRAELDQLNQLASEQAAFRLQASQGVQSALGQRAGYEYQNSMLPYQEASQQQQYAMQAGQAGVQNIWGGIQTGAGAAMQAYSTQQQNQLLRDIYMPQQSQQGVNYSPMTAKVKANYALDKMGSLAAARATESLSALKMNTPNLNYSWREMMGILPPRL